MRQANVKRIILIHLYYGNIIPSNNLELYCKYLYHTYGTQIGSQYLYRVLRELITAGLVERVRVGVQRKGIKRKSYENKYGNKIKNIYRITSQGRAYAKREYYIPGNPDDREANFDTGFFQNLDGTKHYVFEERMLRKYKTKIFADVCSKEKILHEELKYVSSDDFKKKIESKTIKGSRVSGLFELKSFDIAKQKEVVKPVPIICVNGCILSQNATRETRTLDEISSLYGEKVEEEIILGDNYEVLKQYILSEIYSNLMFVVNFVTEPVCELDRNKYFHTLDLTGVSQMKNFDVPKRLRLKYQISELKKKGVIKEYLSDNGIKAAESTKIFASVTDDALVYIGYELDIRSLVILYRSVFELNTAVGYEDKKLIIVCQKNQAEFFKELFQDRTEEATVKDIQIITTEKFI